MYDIVGVEAIRFMPSSARRSLNAPGYYDPRSQEFDASTAAALRRVDTDALLRLDPELASELLAAWRAQLAYCADPYGVMYFVATWLRTQQV